jgi:hypothetical protein
VGSQLAFLEKYKEIWKTLEAPADLTEFYNKVTTLFLKKYGWDWDQNDNDNPDPDENQTEKYMEELARDAQGDPGRMASNTVSRKKLHKVS